MSVAKTLFSPISFPFGFPTPGQPGLAGSAEACPPRKLNVRKDSAKVIVALR